MDIGDRENWYLSTAVGVLLAANAVAWVPRAAGVFEWVALIALATGGLTAMANGVRALRESGGDGDMEWTTRKTRLNAVAVVVLALALAVQAAGYLSG
jgi:hypothetical protein